MVLLDQQSAHRPGKLSRWPATARRAYDGDTPESYRPVKRPEIKAAVVAGAALDVTLLWPVTWPPGSDRGVPSIRDVWSSDTLGTLGVPRLRFRGKGRLRNGDRGMMIQ